MLSQKNFLTLLKYSLHSDKFSSLFVDIVGVSLFLDSV